MTTRSTVVLLALAAACTTQKSAPAPGTTQAAAQQGASASAAQGVAAPNTLTDAERAQGWRLLFDGKTTAGWRGYGLDSMPTGWQVIDGALTRVGPTRDIITKEKFRNFELSLEWNIEPGGNSGILYRVVESKRPIYYSAPEMQVLDDARHADGKNPLTSAGADYALYAPPKGVVKPAGEWNAVRLVVNGNHVEHWLNGQKVVEYELGSPDWAARVKKSKFADWPEYGKASEGYIGLQEHGNRVQFRSIKVKELP